MDVKYVNTTNINKGWHINWATCKLLHLQCWEVGALGNFSLQISCWYAAINTQLLSSATESFVVIPTAAQHCTRNGLELHSDCNEKNLRWTLKCGSGKQLQEERWNRVQHYFIQIKLIYSLETCFCREISVTKLVNASLPSPALFFVTACFGTSAYSLSLSFQIISLLKKLCIASQALTIKVSLLLFSLITMSYLALCTYLPLQPYQAILLWQEFRDSSIAVALFSAST